MSGSGKILVVDDEGDMLDLLEMRLSKAGYEVARASSAAAALQVFDANRPQLVITDLRMDGMDGLALFENLQAAAPTVPVIMLTAHGTIPDAVAATQRGIFSFLTKPFDGQELLRRVADAMRLSPLLDPRQDAAPWRKQLITASVRVEEIVRQALRAGSDGQTVLLVGAPGSGKAALVRAMHEAGPRAAGPLVTLACGDFTAAEVDEFLAPGDAQGVFARAAGGVLYLKDVGALSPIAQARLYARVLAQAQDADPLQLFGQTRPAEAALDAQIVVSTTRPLDGMVAEGAFRSDLYYLLGRLTLLIPPLAERVEEIPVLARHFLDALRPEAGLTLAPSALLALQEARWPGNIRQLRNVLEQAAAASLTPVISEAAIRRVIRESEEQSLAAFDDARRDFERDYLIRLLETTSGGVAHAARIAKRNRTEFYKLLARHGLDPARFKP